jgi:hypothetical protein
MIIRALFRSNLSDIEYRWTQRHVKMTLVHHFDVQKHTHRFEIYNRGYISIGAYRNDRIISRHQCDIKFFGPNKPIERLKTIFYVRIFWIIAFCTLNRCLRETGFPSKINFCARIRSKKSKIIYRLIGDYSHQLYHLAVSTICQITIQICIYYLKKAIFSTKKAVC